MSTGSQQLRDLLRTEIDCYCDPLARVESGEDGHSPDCQWILAVRKVYELERAEDACQKNMGC